MPDTIDLTLPLEVTSSADGVYALHHAWQPPVQGVAVYRHTYGYRCEIHGARVLVKDACPHILAVMEAVVERRVHATG